MRWSELSSDRSVWTIPKERAKKQPRARRAPGAACARDSGQDAAVREIGSRLHHDRQDARLRISKAKARLEAAADELWQGEGAMPGWRLHDFRRTVVTWLAGQGVSPHVCDKLLNHVTGRSRVCGNLPAAGVPAGAEGGAGEVGEAPIGHAGED